MRKPLFAAVLAALTAGVIAVAFSAGSSHREAPNIALDPTADNTDVYAFAPTDAPGDVVLIADWIPGETPSSGPNYFRFDDRAKYYINIDNTGDGKVDIRYLYRFRTHVRNPNNPLIALPPVDNFFSKNLNVYQTYDLFRERFKHGKRRSIRRVARKVPVAPSNVGPKTMPNYAQIAAPAVKSFGGGQMTFAGQRDDPFFIDLGATFDSVNVRKGTGNEGGGTDDIAGTNTFATILRLPKAQVTRDAKSVSSPTASNAVVGVWASSERRRLQVTNADATSSAGFRGGFVQVSRLGNPLVNELIIPLAHKDEFNRTTPDQDLKRYGKFVLKPALAHLLNVLFNVNAPESNRTDIVQALLTGIPKVTQIDPNTKHPLPTDTLKINLGVPPTATPSRFGVIGGDMQGFPNGRRLGDDVVDIDLQVVAGFLKGNKVPLGDGVDSNDKPFLGTFPYEAAPDSGFDQNVGQQKEPPHAPLPAGG